MHRALIAADIIMIAVFGFFYSKLPPQIPLFYSHTWGEDQIADVWYLAVIPIVLHTFYFLNFFIMKKTFKENEVIQNTLRTMNFFMIVSFTFIFVRIILAIV